MNEHDQGTATGRDPADDAAADTRGEGGGAGRHGGRRGRRGHTSQSRQPQGQQRRTESSLNMDELRELTELFTTHSLTDFEFENAEIRVRLSRSPAPQPVAAPTHPLQTPSPAATGADAAARATPEAPREEEKAEDLHLITSPIVGTFYRSSSPDAEPFVRVGSAVESDTIVCIIEAMKLMNEIQSETTGVVEKIFVENGQPVEYGQPLFGVKK